MKVLLKLSASAHTSNKNILFWFTDLLQQVGY